MKNAILILLFVFPCLTSFAQAPSIQWQKSFGGSYLDVGYAIQQTSDGGYIIAGDSWSNNDDVSGNHGDEDYWVIKLNDTGALQWQKSLGGSNHDISRSIKQTSDGGYIVAGGSNSTNGDITGNHGSDDCWIVKLNDTGTIQWQKSFGGSQYDAACAIQQTSDGGYVFAGLSYSNDGDVSGHHWDTTTSDYWIVKLNDTGAIQWQKSLGGQSNDAAYAIQQTSDGGYIVAGSSNSDDSEVTGNHGSDDYWVVKLNDTGAIKWQKSLGGSGLDGAFSIQQTTDSGYIVAGSSKSNDGDVSGNHGGSDYWVVKLNDTGTLQWQKSLGGSQDDYSYSIQQTSDGGYILGGLSGSNDGDITGNHGFDDYWIVKLTDSGAIQWQKSFGGSSYDEAYTMQQITGGYIIAGQSTSNDIDVSGNHGGDDCWIVKLICSAGTISCDSVVCLGGHTGIADTVSGGIWNVTNSNAAISGSVVNGIAGGADTAIYTVNNSCGTASTSFPFTVTPCPSEVNQIPSTPQITIIPNPTTGTLSITGATNATIKVYNTLGQLINQARNTDNISIAEFPAGLYFVRVFNEQGLIVKQDKIIKNP